MFDLWVGSFPEEGSDLVGKNTTLRGKCCHRDGLRYRSCLACFGRGVLGPMGWRV